MELFPVDDLDNRIYEREHSKRPYTAYEADEARSVYEAEYHI